MAFPYGPYFLEVYVRGHIPKFYSRSHKHPKIWVHIEDTSIKLKFTVSQSTVSHVFFVSFYNCVVLYSIYTN